MKKLVKDIIKNPDSYQFYCDISPGRYPLVQEGLDILEAGHNQEIVLVNADGKVSVNEDLIKCVLLKRSRAKKLIELTMANRNTNNFIIECLKDK